MKEITHEDLLASLDYSQETGEFRWKVSPSSRAAIGAVAGGISSKGYRNICFRGKIIPRSRLAWFYVHGAWPPDQVDHINGIRDDDRISNLRLCTQAENNQNVRKRSGTSSSFMGVHWDRRGQSWVATIKIPGTKKVRYLGSHPSEELAAEAYAKAKSELHWFNPSPPDRLRTE